MPHCCEPEQLNSGTQLPSLVLPAGQQSIVNMAAAVGRVLSFSKNAKALVLPLRLSAVPAMRYGVQVSSTGEAITHTGQVTKL